MNTDQGILLSTDLGAPTSIPYFLWDEPMTTAEFRRRLTAASAPEQTRLLAKLPGTRHRCLAFHHTLGNPGSLVRPGATARTAAAILGILAGVLAERGFAR